MHQRHPNVELCSVSISDLHLKPHTALTEAAESIADVASQASAGEVEARQIVTLGVLVAHGVTGC